MSAATTMPDNLPSMAKLNLDSNVVEKSSLHSTQPSSGYVTPKSESLRSTSAATTTAAPTSGPVKTPFSHPLSSSTPVIRPALTTEQASKYDSILESVKAWQTIPTTTARNASEEPITSEERMWLTRECLLRYLRATSWSVPDALKRLQYTMAWKREYEVSTFTADYISPENETGKQVILGYDANARPCLYMNPGKQNTKKSEKQIHHTVYMLERAIDMMDAGQETTALLINFKNSTSGSSPSVGQGKQVLNILQSHYPERLGRALISDLPWYITTFFKLISPFIDPVTKEKMVFNQDLRQYVPPSQLDKAYGGDVDFVYDHSVYWSSLDKQCKERRAAYRERWIAGGEQIGEYEAYLRGGDQAPLKSEKPDPAA